MNNIKEDEKIYFQRFMNFIYNKYNLKSIKCSYIDNYNGYVFWLEKNKEIFFFIFKKDFDNFIMLEKMSDMNKNINCRNVLNNLYNNITSLLLKTYYFNDDNFDILNTPFKETHKIINISSINLLIE